MPDKMPAGRTDKPATILIYASRFGEHTKGGNGDYKLKRMIVNKSETLQYTDSKRK